MPRKSLQRQRSGLPGPWVMRMEGRHATRRPVQLGLRSGGLAEVRGGLAEGDAVLVGSVAVTTGARVRATSATASAATSAASSARK